jgi:uncharacterized protein
MANSSIAVWRSVPRLLAAFLIVFLAQPVFADAGRRVALVIGNAAYRWTMPLANSSNDAEDVAAALLGLGFEVLKGIDLSKDDMRRITTDFAKRAPTADIAFMYYSGHAIQFQRENFLVPVDAHINEYDLREMLKLSQMVADASQASKLGLVVLDASREDPLSIKSLARIFGSQSGNFGAGLSEPNLPPSKSLIVYAAAPHSYAYEGGRSRDSTFTAALLLTSAHPNSTCAYCSARWPTKSGELPATLSSRTCGHR